MNPLNLPEIPQTRIDFARFRTDHGVFKLPIDPSLVVWHVSTETKGDHLVHRISGDPIAFDKDPGAQAFPSLDEALAYCRNTAPAPAPGIQTTRRVSTPENCIIETCDPTIVYDSSSPMPPARAAELRQYLLDTGPMACRTEWARKDLVTEFPDLFYTKSVKDNTIAARPLQKKPKKPAPNPLTPPTAAPAEPAPTRKPKTPLEIHAELRHLPAVNHFERRERRNWLLVRGAIPIPYHRAFFRIMTAALDIKRFDLKYDYMRRHARPFQDNLDITVSVFSPCLVDPSKHGSDKFPDYHEFDAKYHLRCNQSEPDYREEIQFFTNINSEVAESLDRLLAPELYFHLCPTYRPHIRSAELPNPFVHFLRRYRRDQIINALSIYHSFLPHLASTPPLDSGRFFEQDVTAAVKANRELLHNLVRLQRAMGLRTYPDQTSRATHLSAEELDSL